MEIHHWQDILNACVSRQNVTPPHVSTLRLPLIDGWEKNRVWCTFDVDPDLVQPQGALFGGYLSAVADELMGMATFTALGADTVFSTSDLKIQYFRPVSSGKIAVEATILNISRSRIHVEATFKNEDGKLIAKAAATQSLQQLNP